MKQIIKIVILMILPSLLFAQSNKNIGINFEKVDSWQELITRAQRTNKFIFVDMYATWCIPCREMDKNTYSSEQVGVIANLNFISVKFQADKTHHDDDATKKIRHLADSLTTLFKVSAFPTLIFLTPEGKLILKEEGYKDIDSFSNLLARVATTKNGYQAKIDLYNSRQLTYPDMPDLAWEAAKIGDNKMAKEIAGNYNDNYLSKQPPVMLLTTDNLQTIVYFVGIDNSTSPYFKMIYENRSKVDSLMHRELSNGIVERIINKEEIDSVIYKRPVNSHPDWQSIYQRISKKYDKKYADKLVLPAKLAFNQKENQWTKFSQIIDRQILKKKIGEKTQFLGNKFGDAWALNTYAWNVFLKCTDKSVLKKALSWVDLALRVIKNPADSEQYLDTKANILYKIGRKQLAIEIEKTALAIDSAVAKGSMQETYVSALKKMKNNQPTWSISN